MDITYAPKFRREFKKLPRKLQEQVAVREDLFKQDPFHNSLKTHKLSGRLSEFWAFSITYSHRVIFDFVSDGKVHFLSVGDHDIYR